MSNKSVPTTLVLIILVSLIPLSLVYSPSEASSLSDSRLNSAPEAWIEDWGVYVSEDLRMHSDHQTRNNDGDYGYDDAGNFYFAYQDENVDLSTGDDIYDTSGRGIYVHKLDPFGDLVWSKKITNSRNDCDHWNRWECKLMGMHVTGEDTFYLVWQSYHTKSWYLSDDIEISTSGHDLIVAHHSPDGWDYAEYSDTRGWGIDYTHKQMLDDSGNLVIVEKSTDNGQYQTYKLRTYNSTGVMWERNLETYYGEPLRNRYPLLVDTFENNTEIMVTTKNNIKYDSQSISCPPNSQEDVCHIWITIGTDGVKSDQTKIRYTSMEFVDMAVGEEGAYLLGTTRDHIRGNNGQSNFSGFISDYGDYTAYVAMLQRDGNWSFNTDIADDSSDHLVRFFDSDDEGFANIFVQPDGDVTFSFQSYDHGYYGSESFEIKGQISIEAYQTYVNIDKYGNYLSNTTFAFYDVDYWDSDYFAKPVIGEDGYLAIWLDGRGGANDVILPNGSSNYGGLAFVSYQSGELMDYEPIITWDHSWIIPMAISPNGDLMTHNSVRYSNQWYRYFQIWGVDSDSDDIGASDNCPDDYNPGQEDYDEDDIGDACDIDDDDDGVPDLFDYCAMGIKDWESDEFSDHDSDGCRDGDIEDLDDDNDGVVDDRDQCPRGLIGEGEDLDGDGCQNPEDSDDDNDNVDDGSDLCSPGKTNWLSGTLTDHDGDGCHDDDEDGDDDNDGIFDPFDQCPKGMTNWKSNANTDRDEDGCMDNVEDLDCCTDTSENGVYYICPYTSEVVTDISECQEEEEEEVNDTENETSIADELKIVYICPNTYTFVENLDDCPESIRLESENETEIVNIIIDPEAETSENYTICDDGILIVSDELSCGDYVPKDEQTTVVSPEGSLDETVMYISIAAILFCILSLLLIYRKISPDNGSKWVAEDIDKMFNQSSLVPQAVNWDGGERPPVSLTGENDGGYEWIEWPSGSDKHWYRAENTKNEWQRYMD